ncbi:glycoside hydrolase family 5 protein [Duganella sp. P38]|uniref:glycoside hydrolase family 5 protein n=1 Tax=Duganella sp. P38 TaxID=3423949 RepID=UPI003D796E24
MGATNTYPVAPFAGPLSLTTVKDADLVKLRTMGFDFVRLPVDPGPFIVATGTQKTALFTQLTTFIKRLHAADLKVMVDVHPATYQSDWKPADIITDTTLPKFATYGDFLVQLARLLKDMPYDKIALEIMNEPQGVCKRTDGGPEWSVTQRRFWSKIRVAVPKLPLVVTGPCWSSVDGIIKLEPIYFDAATLYDVHFYDPHEFTHQSLSWSANPINLTSGLSYPYNSGNAAKTLLSSGVYQAAQVPKLAPTTALQADLNNFLTRYYTVTKPDKAYITKRFALVTAWATKNKVPAKNIIVGEFGAVRWLPSIEDGSRARWVADVKDVAEASGFGWAVWDYDKVFGLVLDYPTQTLDTRLVEALGMKVPAAAATTTTTSTKK